MVTFSKPKSRYEIRSISLPSRSHPTTVRVNEKLHQLEKWEASSTTTSVEKICNGLRGLNEVYKCFDDVLNLPLTRKALSLHQRYKRWIDESLDMSVRLLDVCGITMDFACQTKKYVKDLESAIRRRKVDSIVQISIAKYFRFRKEMNKGAKKLKTNVKQIGNKIASLSMLDQLDNNHQVSAVIRVLREVNSITISVYHLVLLVLSAPISKPPKSTTWFKLLDKGRVACEAQKENGNELHRVDAALNNIWKCGGLSEGEKVKTAQDELKQLEASFESIESGLECLFKGLIKVRATLLNIISL